MRFSDVFVQLSNADLVKVHISEHANIKTVEYESFRVGSGLQEGFPESYRSVAARRKPDIWIMCARVGLFYAGGDLF